MNDRLDLSGRTAIVTGASRGIGLAIADTLAKRGANVVLGAHRDIDYIAHVASRLAATHDVKTWCAVGDVADPETSAALARLAFANTKRLDIYINNAGVLLDGLIGMVPQTDIDSTIGINLAGVLHGIQSAARLMARSGGGSIVNMASIIGRVGNVGQLAYGASKAGVIGATLSAAKELAPKNIRVNAVAPGFIETDMVRQIPSDKFKERLRSIAMGRIGTPQDVADTVLFLASDMSRYVTGQVIGVDGGMVI